MPKKKPKTKTKKPKPKNPKTHSETVPARYLFDPLPHMGDN